MAELKDALKIFEVIHDLISSHDDLLRASPELYSHVRKCFRMLYENVGEGEKTEKSYHGVHEEENWSLKKEVYKEYEAMMQTVETELRAACVEYHSLKVHDLHYEPYCAFMDTYRMCMNYMGKPAYPTETKEKYLSQVVDERMWTRMCGEIEITENVDETYLKSQLKENTALKSSVIELAIHLSLTLPEYKIYNVVEGFNHALNVVLNTLQLKYMNTPSIPRTNAQMNRDAIKYLQGELQEYDTHTPSQGIVANEETYIDREDKKKLMVDLISTVYARCREKSLQRSEHIEYNNFMDCMEFIYEKVLIKRGAYTSLNYSPNEQLTTELERLLDESYDIFLKMRKKYIALGQKNAYQKLESASVFLNTVMNRLDDGKVWQAHVLKDGCWEMGGADGAMQRITVEHPMLKVAYTSKEEKHCFVRSFMRKLERQCQSTSELIPVEDVDMHAAFQTFHENVSAIAKGTTKMLELWKPTYDSWLKIEPEIQDTYERWLQVEPEKREELLMHEKHLINIGVAVHFLESIAIDLAKVDFEWIIMFKLGNLQLKWAKKDRTCVVCLEREREVVLHPCRHYCLCVECSDRLSQCPICRGPIEDTVDFATVISEGQDFYVSTQFPESGGYTRRLLMELETLGMSI